jgi:hypothetical protein
MDDLETFRDHATVLHRIYTVATLNFETDRQRYTQDRLNMDKRPVRASTHCVFVCACVGVCSGV